MIKFYPLLPVWLISLSGFLAVWVILFTARSRFDLTLAKRYKLAGFRLAAVAIVLVMLLCPGIVVTEQNRQRSNIVFLLDGSGSMATTDLPECQSRFDGAVKVLENLMGYNFKRTKKHYYKFNSTSVPFKDLNELNMFVGQQGTDMKQAFKTIDNDVGFSRIAAVVLLSDGIDHSGFSGTHAGLPIFAIKFGTDMTTVPDLRLEPFTFPKVLRTHEEMSLLIPMILTGYPSSEKVAVTITVDGRQEKETQRELEPGNVEQVVFKKAFSKPGIHIVKIALSKLANEAGYLNNEREFAIEVKEGQHETICYFPKLTNSFRPLIRLLKATGKRFTAVYKMKGATVNSIGTDVNPAFKNGIPQSAESMKQIDAFVLAANREGILTPREEAVLEQYVANGGHLIQLGGTDSFGALSPTSPLAALMPVKSSHINFMAGRFHIVPPEKNKNSFTERIEKLCDENAVIKGLNRIETVKKGADVLLYAKGDRRYPLVVARQYGQGSVIAILTNSLHLWGKGKFRQLNFGTFWEQILNFAGKSRDDLLTVAVNSDYLKNGEQLKVTATVKVPAVELMAPDFSVEAALYPIGTEHAIEKIALLKDGPFYSSLFAPLKAGRYMLNVSCRKGTRIISQRYRLINVGEKSSENYQLQVRDENFLKFCPAGRLYGAEEEKRLVGDIITTIQKNDIEREWYPVFETPFFFLALLGCLLIGWYLRRRYNLF